MELLIVAKSGWSKSIKTTEGVIRIGSAPTNDIQLQSPKIAPVHLQILHPADSDPSCKVVNLSHEITAKVSREVHRLPPCTAVDVHDGDEILLDDYLIVVRLRPSSGVTQSAESIEATLSFVDAILHPASATTGTLTIKNTGEHSVCQFQVDIEGLPEDCFEIDPVPLMYSGAQDEVRIQVFHRICRPPAGLRTIALKVSAPEVYPSEELIIRQDVYVTPIFRQSLELFDDLSVAVERKEQVETFHPAEETIPLVEPSPPAVIESSETRSAASGQTDLTPPMLPGAVSMESFVSNPPRFSRSEGVSDLPHGDQFWDQE